MKKLLVLFALFPIVIGCEPETMIIDDTVQEEENITVFNYSLSSNGDVLYEDGFAKIPIVATATPNPLRLGVRFVQNNQEVPGGIIELTNSGNIYTRDDNNFQLTMSEINNGILIAELWTQEPDQNAWNPAEISVSVTIQWPDDMTDSGDNPECEFVRFTTIERINVPDGDPFYRLGYMDNSDISADGGVTIQLWRNGAFQNISSNARLIQQTGFINSDPLFGLIENEVYQFRIISQENETPVYKFLDINDMVSESHVFSFTATDNPVSAIATSNIQFTDKTSTSFNTSLTINVDSDEPETLRVRLYDAEGAGGNFISGTEQSIQTNPTNTAETFIAVFNSLDMNTTYDVRYFLNNETVAFFNGTVTTSSAGSSDTEIESTSANVNTVFAVIENDNATGNDINAEVRFTGIDINGNPRIETDSLVFFNGNNDTDIDVSESGFRQNSSVLIEVIINGAVIVSTSVQTNENNYGSYVFTNGGNNTIDLISNQSSTVVGNVNFTSIGFAQATTVHLRHTFPVGLNLNQYNDNIRIDESQTVDVIWVETSSGVWETDFIYTIDISPGMNNFEVALGNESYAPSGGAGTMDTGILTVTLTDDNSFIIGENSLGITINYLE